MEKTIFEQMGGTYTRQGDYYLPNLLLPAEENKPIGIWGQRHLRYLKQHRKVLYTNLLTSGKLNSYLADIDEQAEDMFLRLVEQMAEREGITEQLKAKNPMKRVGKMNALCEAAVDIVNTVNCSNPLGCVFCVSSVGNRGRSNCIHKRKRKVCIE